MSVLTDALTKLLERAAYLLRGRYYALGLGQTKVAAHESLVVAVHPDVAFRPERLVVPSTIAGHFQVVNFKVGRINQLRSIGSLPAVMFTENVFDVSLESDVARPSDLVSVEVLNTSDDEQVFQGGICGPVA
jgi:hypothetical protein